jgi:hypothetical protein
MALFIPVLYLAEERTEETGFRELFLAEMGKQKETADKRTESAIVHIFAYCSPAVHIYGLKMVKHALPSINQNATSRLSHLDLPRIHRGSVSSRLALALEKYLDIIYHRMAGSR